MKIIQSLPDISKCCNDKNFAFEYNKNKEFSNCCDQRKVELPETPL